MEEMIEAEAVATRTEWLPRAPRAVTTLLVGRLLDARRRDYPCRVRNLSPSGMLIEADRTLTGGTPVSVELRSGARLAGRVAWSHAGRAGVNFETAIDVERLLADAVGDPAGGEAEAARGPRFHVGCRAQILCQGKLHGATIGNISQSGAHVRFDRPARISGEVTLTAAGIDRRRCAVRWIDPDNAGLAFRELLPFEVLTRIVGGHRAGA